MTQESLTPHMVATQLAKEPSVAFRIALEKQEDTWQLHTLMLDGFPIQPGEEVLSFNHAYGQAAFLAGVIAGEVAATWLTPQTILLGGAGSDSGEYEVQMPLMQEHVNWQRFPRNTLYDYGRVPWPHTRYELYWPGRTTSVKSPEFLISDTCPFFPSFQAALYDLIYRGTDAAQRAQMSAGPNCIVRLAHPEAWLEHICISSTALTLTVAGTEKEGAFLEVSGPPLRRWKQQIGTEGTINFPLTTPLPDDWWVMLSRGSRWLDYYHHQARWTRFSAGLPHVTTELPAVTTDLAVLIQDWVTRGEGQQIEYKLDLSSDLERILHTVAAFANGEGGVILVGVPDKHPSIVGYPGDIDAAKRRFISSVRDNLTSQPPITIEQVEVEGKMVLVISVEPGDEPPYGMKSKNASSPATFYIRHDSSNYIAQAHEIHAMVRQRLPPTQQAPTGGLGLEV